MARAEPSSGSPGWEGVRAGRAAGREDHILSLAFHPAWLFWGYFLSSGGSKGLHQELTARAASSATRCLRSEPPEHTPGSLCLYLASGCLHSEQPVGLSKNALPKDEKSGIRFHVFHSSGRSLITRLHLLGLPLLVGTEPGAVQSSGWGVIGAGCPREQLGCWGSNPQRGCSHRSGGQQLSPEGGTSRAWGAGHKQLSVRAGQSSGPSLQALPVPAQDAAGRGLPVVTAVPPGTATCSPLLP